MINRLRSLHIGASEAEHLAEVFQQVVDSYGTNLVSLIVYGSSVAGGYEEGVSDINLAIILRRVTVDDILKAAPAIRSSPLRLSPRFFDLEGVEALPEAYPLELRDMQVAHLLVYGQQVLPDLHVDQADIRRECRRALRGIATRMRHHLVMAGDDKKRMVAIIEDTLRGTMSVLRHLLRLEGKQIPAEKDDLISNAARDYKFDPEPFLRALDCRDDGFPDAEIPALFRAYFEAVQSLAARAGELTGG